MKNSPLTTILLGALAVLVLGAVWFCWLALHRTSELRALNAQLQYQANQINANQQAVNALVAETVDYAKTHPAIEPVLESAGVKTSKTATAPAPGPANPKPATK